MVKHGSINSSFMQYSVSLSLLCPSLSLTSTEQARYTRIIDRLVAKQSYLKLCCLYWQDSSYSSAAVWGNSSDVMSHLFLPETKIMGCYCLQHFFQLQVFCFCCLRVQNIWIVLLCLLVTPNFMFAVFAAWSTLNFKCHVCVPCKLSDTLVFSPPRHRLLSVVFLFFELLWLPSELFFLLQRTLIFKCLTSVPWSVRNVNWLPYFFFLE